MSPGYLQIDREERPQGSIYRLTVARPERLNVVDSTILNDLKSALAQIAAEERARVVVLCGAGTKAWIAGADIHDMVNLDPQSAVDFIQRLHRVCAAIRELPVPVLARIDGYCLGAGITLLLPHDLAIASQEKARFGLPEVMRGFLPYPIVATIFRANIPTKLAFELILTGKNWNAEKAMEAGLINRVVPHRQLAEEAWKWGEEIAQWDKLTLQYCKMAAHASMEAATVPAAAEIAWLMQPEHSAINSKAFEGMRDFLDKKGPKAR